MGHVIAFFGILAQRKSSEHVPTSSQFHTTTSLDACYWVCNTKSLIGFDQTLSSPSKSLTCETSVWSFDHPPPQFVKTVLTTELFCMVWQIPLSNPLEKVWGIALCIVLVSSPDPPHHAPSYCTWSNFRLFGHCLQSTSQYNSHQVWDRYCLYTMHTWSLFTSHVARFTPPSIRVLYLFDLLKKLKSLARSSRRVGLLLGKGIMYF